MRIQNPESRINHLIRAYKGLKSLFDPTVEGNPYVREIERARFTEPKRSLFISRRLRIRGI